MNDSKRLLQLEYATRDLAGALLVALPKCVELEFFKRAVAVLKEIDAERLYEDEKKTAEIKHKGE